MNFRLSTLGAAALLGLSAAAAWAQEPADPIAGILEQAQEAPNPIDPEAESVPTSPDAAPPAQVPVEPPVQPPPAPFTPQTPASPPPSVGYVLPPVNHAPPTPAPPPYVPPAYVPPVVPATPQTYARPPAAPYEPEAPAPRSYTPPPAATPVAPYVPPYVPPPRPRLSAPVHIDETGKAPDAPPGPVDLSYEMRLRASSASAQGLQGPLDGAWTLRASPGGELYSLLLVDNGMTLEGAWRDPRRRGAVDASGFFNDVVRTGGGVSMNFYPAPGAGLAVVTLSPAADGSWTGELDQGGRRRNVTLRRD